MRDELSDTDGFSRAGAKTAVAVFVSGFAVDADGFLSLPGDSRWTVIAFQGEWLSYA